MIRTTNGSGVSSRSIGKPAAKYPAAIATDQDLAIGLDRQQTQLSATLSDTATSMQVANPAMIVTWSLLSIDNEIVQVIGPPSGSTVPIKRGFDGTAPAVHLSGAVVAGLVDAYHHNTLVAEVEAIENALGPNLSNLPATAVLNCCGYDFSRTPGGTLGIGSNVITLSPMPPGLAVGGYLYISGGTGAAETVPIIGTSTSTVIVTCANAHSGAWTIKSATGGMQEAIGALPASGGKIVQSCNITLNANVLALGKNVQIEKQPGYTVGNLANPYTILGSTAYNPYGSSSWSTEVVVLGAHSNGQMITTYPADDSVRIIRTVASAPDQGYAHNALWVQEDFNGTTGTPGTIMARLNCSNNTASNGVAAVLGYTVLGANSTTAGIGVHGDCTINHPAASGIAVNAEGNYMGSTAGGTMFGFVSNLIGGGTAATTVTGAYIIMNANPGGVLNNEGGIRVVAASGSLHKYGLLVYDQGGTFQQTAIFYSEQASANNVNILNGSAASVGVSNIHFRRSGDIHSAANVGLLASIAVTHPSGNFSAGSIQLRTSANGSTTNVGLTVDSSLLVTVANCVRTTPTTAALLPAPAASIGSWACISDSTVNTVGSVVVGGGGTYTVGVFCSSRGWVVVAN
jgi:hypothetical protein